MPKSSIERSFEDAARAHRQKRGDAETTVRTLSDRAAQPAERRAEARRAGRYPAPATEGRSRNMQAIRRTDTKPEIALRSALHRLGYRFRKDLRLDADGRWVRPDLVFTRRKVAVFVDGCFWHGCPEHGRTPRVNDEYWGPKLARTRHRDLLDVEALARAEWHVVRLWEHVPLTEAVASVEAVLEAAPSAGAVS
jgi:DNA mismatch endonuclease (patch repair protein)